MREIEDSQRDVSSVILLIIYHINAQLTKEVKESRTISTLEKCGSAVKQFRTEAVGRAPVEKPEMPSTPAKRDLPLDMTAVVTKRVQEKHSSVIRTDDSGELQLNETDQVLRTSVSMNRSCTENVSPSTESLEMRIPGESGFQIEGLIQGTKVILKVDTGARRSFITEETYNNIIPENKPVLERVRTQFLSADRQEINTIGTAKMTLTLGNVDIEQRLFVGGVKKI